jgi:hypothetical protein
MGLFMRDFLRMAKPMAMVDISRIINIKYTLVSGIKIISRAMATKYASRQIFAT